MHEWEWHLLEDGSPLPRITVSGVELTPGARVKLRPRAGGDILDLALAGRTATIESIEQDYEDNIQIAVTVDDDPGRDLGKLRQPGPFFFAPDEIEPLFGEEG
jgi:hypothetical protein